MVRNISSNKKPCACGCGVIIPVTDRRGRPHNFIAGHSARKMSQETKEKIRRSLMGKIGPESRGWKGDNIISMSALHHWVRKYLPKPAMCQSCKIRQPYDLANITGVYTRDFTNWKYLCRKCHAALDDYVRKSWITRKKSLAATAR